MVFCSSVIISVQITASEYNRFLQLEVLLNKYKGLCEKKGKQIKQLQDQVARYKRKGLKRSGDEHESADSIIADGTDVKKIII